MQAVEVNNVINFAEKKESNLSQLKEQLAEAEKEIEALKLKLLWLERTYD